MISFLNENLDPSYLYHNLIHTQRVVKKTKELIDGMQINEKDAQRLLVSAWFHDTGFVNGHENHEKESALIAESFLKEQNIPKADISEIKNLILSTEMEAEPANHLEGLIRDADCAHLASKNFIDVNELLRKELELTTNKSFSDAEWLHENIEFLFSHQEVLGNHSP